MKYYTYTHSTPEGVVFYVGKGSGRRVYSMCDRSYIWREALSKLSGILMQIVERYATEDEAYEAEKTLTRKYLSEGFALVNKTEGGRGANGYKQSAETKRLKSEKLSGCKHKIVTCPHCGDVGGATSMKRWHFDKCKGSTPKVKARVTIDGNRIFLGNYHTKDEADEVMISCYKEHGKTVPKEFYFKDTGRDIPLDYEPPMRKWKENVKLNYKQAGASVALFTIEQADDIIEMKHYFNITCKAVSEIVGCSASSIQRLVNGTTHNFKRSIS